ncbi:MAG: ATP-binding protein, partial [Gemmatimonadaceae bacterium]
NLLKMLREGLLGPVRDCVQRAKRERTAARREGVRARSDRGDLRVNVEVIPLSADSDAGYLVLFEEPEPRAAKKSAKPLEPKRSKADDDDIARLQQELADAREYSQSVMEQKDAANEELQSANEEVQSANEELQSTNEELSTSKEEIESTNEELSALNDELDTRNIELHQINNDVINLINSVQVAIVMVGSDLRIRRFTPKAERQLNLSAHDIDQPIGQMLLPIAIPGLERQIVDAIATASEHEQEVQDRDRWYSVRIRPYITLDHRIDGAVLSLVDITALKATESALRFQANLLEEVHEPVLVWELDGRITYWNRAAQEYYGYTPDQALGRERAELLAGRVPAAWFRSSLTQSGRWSGELAQTRNDGESIVVDTRMTLFREGASSLVLETHHPITELKRVQRELRDRAEELSLGDRRKNEFLAMLAHELRDPLAPLSNALHAMKERMAETAARAPELAVMERQVRKMARLVDDLLDVARITSGRITLEKEPVALGALLSNVADDVRPTLDRRGQEFAVRLPQDPLIVAGDPTRLEQIVRNLLSNASKFSAAGGHIRLTATRGDSGDSVTVSVADDGIGLAPEDLTRIFDLFEQVDTSIARSTGGLGVGLTLVRNLVRLHGGTVEAHSEGRDLGSEFVVQLPLLRDVPRPRQPERSSVAPRARHVHRVLVVDDNTDGAKSLADLLRLKGFEVSVEASGNAALKTAAAFNPQAVILDLGLPGMSGLEVARRLRETPGGRDVLLIALSGYGQEYHLQQSQEAGFDQHLTKPADLDALLVSLRGGEVTGAPRGGDGLE